jgi:hypothetical protein
MNRFRIYIVRWMLGWLMAVGIVCLQQVDAQAPASGVATARVDRGVRDQLWQNQALRDAGALVPPVKIQRKAPKIKRQDVRDRLGPSIQGQLKNQTRNAVKQIQRNRMQDLIRDRARENMVQQRQHLQQQKAVPSKQAVVATRQQTADPASDISQRRISIAGAETGVDSSGNKVTTQQTTSRPVTKMTRTAMREMMQVAPTSTSTTTTTADTDTRVVTDDRTTNTDTRVVDPTPVVRPTTDVKPAPIRPRPVLSDIQPVDPAPPTSDTPTNTAPTTDRKTTRR